MELRVPYTYSTRLTHNPYLIFLLLEGNQNTNLTIIKTPGTKQTGTKQTDKKMGGG